MAKQKTSLRLIERRRHPRFLLSHEQFKETRSGRVFSVYDLSAGGLSVKVDAQYWTPGAVIAGIVNLHPESIEVSPRLLGYYGDRAALRIEALSTYAREVLLRALSPRRLGQSLKLVRERLPLTDLWLHGLCNTDVLIRVGPDRRVTKAEVFFSNFYWAWTEAISGQSPDSSGTMITGVCQSLGSDEREGTFLAEEPVTLEAIQLQMDKKPDAQKLRWALGILEAAMLEPKIKEFLVGLFR